MVIQGTMLRGTFTIAFSMHQGEFKRWTVTVSAPGSEASECETEGTTPPWDLLNEMLADAYAVASHSRLAAPAGARR